MMIDFVTEGIDAALDRARAAAQGKDVRSAVASRPCASIWRQA